MKYALELDTNSYDWADRDHEDLNRLFRDNNEWLAAPDLPTTLGGKRQTTYRKIFSDSTHTFYRLEPAPSTTQASLGDPRYFQTAQPVLGVFYRTPANYYEVNSDYFYIRANPILNFQVSKGSGAGNGLLVYNQRGIEIRGGVDDRIYFYSNITDTQASFPDYVNQYVNKFGALPGNGLVKNYDSKLFGIKNGYDYLNGQAYIGFNITQHVGLQFGHGRNFIGNGYRSLLLSDFSHNYLYLKLNWQLGPIRYQNIFAELEASSKREVPGDKILPKKYIAAHYLGFPLFGKLQAGFYEVTVFNRKADEQYELNYLNPVILYRTVEHFIGSPDNVLVGFDVKANLLRRFQVYGQLVLDEFKFEEYFKAPGWWAKKYGVQAGVKYVDAFGVSHLDLQAEANTVRPYTFSHYDTLGPSYSHYNQALAHPLGANFKEVLFLVRYQPFEKWTLDGRLIRSKYGEDPAGQNWGGNVLLPNNTRVQDYNNETGQGIGTNTTLLGIDLGFEVWHNVYFELNYFYRKKDSAIPALSSTDSYFGGGVRINVGKMRMDF